MFTFDQCNKRMIHIHKQVKGAGLKLSCLLLSRASEIVSGLGVVMMAGMARRDESQMIPDSALPSSQLMPVSSPAPVRPRPAAPANAESHLPFVQFTSQMYIEEKYWVLKTQLRMTTVLWGRNLSLAMKTSSRSPTFCHLIHWCLTFCSMWDLWRCMK